MRMIRNGLLRLLRTPVKTVLFFLLLTVTVALVCAGGSLWKLCGDNLKRFEEIFMTIATVEQMPERTEQEAVWSADREDYRYYNRAVYGETVSPAVLDFEGAGYLSGPEQRAYYEALPQDYAFQGVEEGLWQFMVVEASPVEDCVPAGPVKMELRRVLYSTYPPNVTHFYLCDHYTEKPQTLYAEKTYVMALQSGFAHDYDENGSAARYEYVPLEGPYSTQADPEGRRLATDLTGNWIMEVTPGFYDSKEGQSWMKFCEDCMLRGSRHLSFPVTATEDLHLIMAFYNRQAYLTEGELFSEEDYRQGNKVCLVPSAFAGRNGLKAGDSLHLALRYANYAVTPNLGGSEGRLTADGGVYEPFEESDYTIKGIYEVNIGTIEGGWGYLPERNEVFIPTASIKNSNENSIARYGPMKGYTTSFRIPNGSESMENYKKLWEAQGIDNVEITFYDGGYSKLEGGLENMKTMSLILLLTGIVSAACIVIFFCHLFITKQQKQTAIERCLGMTKGQCARSLLTGVALISLMGSVSGGCAGQLFANTAAAQMSAAETFDTRFSNGEVQLNAEKNAEEITEGNADESTMAGSAYLRETDWRISVLCSGLVFLFTMGMAFGGIYGNLRKEPLALLAETGK